MKPLTLAPVDRRAQLTASALAQHLRSEPIRTAAATCWARALEVSVAVRDAGVDEPGTHDGCTASAGLVLADGRRAHLTVSTQLLAGLMGALAGATPRAIGPAPISPAEEGLFAFLALQWTALWPEPPALDWIDGGARLIEPSCATRTSAVSWHVTVADQTGVVRWHLPADLPPPPRQPSDCPQLPVHALLSAGQARCSTVLCPGDLIVLTTPARLWLGEASWPMSWRAGHWHMVSEKEARMPDPMDEPPVHTLPVLLDAVVGRVTLTVADVAAFAPGVVLPLSTDATPIVTLMARGTPIARGILVDDEGRTAVQITQLLGSRAGS